MFHLDAKRDRDGGVIYRGKTTFNLPLKRDRAGNFKVPDNTRLRVCMTSDFFLAEADEWRDEAWEIIRQRSGVLFWLLTKRPERIADHLPADWGDGWDNVALNVSCENQTRAKERLPLLLEIPAKHKGFMAAPFIGPINAEPYLASGQFELVYADGENYAGARPLHYDWVKSLYEQCVHYDIPFTFFGIGNVFVKDGKEYHVPRAYQHVQALRSGLQYPPSTEDCTMQPRCATCRHRFDCNGCKHCGKC